MIGINFKRQNLDTGKPFTDPKTPMQHALMNLTKPKRYKLKSIVFTYIVGQMLLINEREEMAQIFHKLDYNSDGEISIEEIIQKYKTEFNEKPNQQQLHNLKDHLAGLNENSIQFSDFMVHACKESLLQSSDRLATAFRYFDTDGSGSISPDEVVDGLNFGDE